MPSLVDRFCPNVHDAPIVAAAYDPRSGTQATADTTGLVAVKRPGEATPLLTVQMGAAVTGALTLVEGGEFVAAGDDHGTVTVFRTDTGDVVFRESRDGARGKVRAMRGLSLSRDGSKLAAIAIDGLLRVWDLQRKERNAWRGFSGSSVQFDPRGQRLIAVDDKGQPRLMDLMTVKALYMDRLQTPAEHVAFTADGTMVVAAGQSGISLLRVADGTLVTSFATRGGSGIIAMLMAPDGKKVAAVTQRSLHVFGLPGLEPIESLKHGAKEPSGAAYWTQAGIRVAGSDGLMHGGGSTSSGPVTTVGGFGPHRLAVHGTQVFGWNGNRRTTAFDTGVPLREIHVDRDGRLIVAVPQRGPLQVFDHQTGRPVFEGGPETSGSSALAVGGTVVAAQLHGGGIRWWDLGNNSAFELRWPRAMALSHGGTWLAVVTPKGHVRVIDPASGRDAIPAPHPLSDAPVRRLAFVNRRPDLLVLDEEGVLGHYDLASSAKQKLQAEGRDILSINVQVDQMWGITGGKYCALRLPEGNGATVLFIDLRTCAVVHEITGLSKRAWVDPENGLILEPARSSAIVERTPDGKERRVLRSLPDDQWVAYSWNGILDSSDRAAEAL